MGGLYLEVDGDGGGVEVGELLRLVDELRDLFWVGRWVGGWVGGKECE